VKCLNCGRDFDTDSQHPKVRGSASTAATTLRWKSQTENTGEVSGSEHSEIFGRFRCLVHRSLPQPGDVILLFVFPVLSHALLVREKVVQIPGVAETLAALGTSFHLYLCKFILSLLRHFRSSFRLVSRIYLVGTSDYLNHNPGIFQKSAFEGRFRPKSMIPRRKKRQRSGGHPLTCSPFMESRRRRLPQELEVSRLTGARGEPLPLARRRQTRREVLV
jgi:hypothetical protein